MNNTPGGPYQPFTGRTGRMLGPLSYLTLVHPVFRWLHWATRRCHSTLSFVSSSASYQVRSICRRFRLMTSTQFFLGRHVFLL